MCVCWHNKSCLLLGFVTLFWVVSKVGGCYMGLVARHKRCLVTLYYLSDLHRTVGKASSEPSSTASSTEEKRIIQILLLPTDYIWSQSWQNLFVASLNFCYTAAFTSAISEAAVLPVCWYMSVVLFCFSFASPSSILWWFTFFRPSQAFSASSHTEPFASKNKETTFLKPDLLVLSTNFVR